MVILDEYTGLVNVGNSCYMNAALQALCTTDPLNKYFEQGLAQWETNDSNQNGYHGKLVANFSILISQLAEASIASFAPSKLRNVLGMYACIYLVQHIQWCIF